MGDPISSLYGSIDVYSRLAGLSAPGLLFFTSKKSLIHAWLRSGSIESVHWELLVDIQDFTSVNGLHGRMLEVHLSSTEASTSYWGYHQFHGKGI